MSRGIHFGRPRLIDEAAFIGQMGLTEPGLDEAAMDIPGLIGRPVGDEHAAIIEYRGQYIIVRGDDDGVMASESMRYVLAEHRLMEAAARILNQGVPLWPQSSSV